MKNPFHLSALTMAVRQLEETRRQILEHEGSAEFHVAMSRMLHARAARLSSAVAELSADPDQPKPLKGAP